MITINGVNKVGYERKKKTQKTKESQYVETDEHPFQKETFSHGGVSFNGKDGSVLSGSVPYLCFAIKNQNCTKSP